jgi:hypothetical protein
MGVPPLPFSSVYVVGAKTTLAVSVAEIPTEAISPAGKHPEHGNIVSGSAKSPFVPIAKAMKRMKIVYRALRMDTS